MLKKMHSLSSAILVLISFVSLEGMQKPGNSQVGANRSQSASGLNACDLMLISAALCCMSLRTVLEAINTPIPLVKNQRPLTLAQSVAIGEYKPFPNAQTPLPCLHPYVCAHSQTTPNPDAQELSQVKRIQQMIYVAQRQEQEINNFRNRRNQTARNHTKTGR